MPLVSGGLTMMAAIAAMILSVSAPDAPQTSLPKIGMTHSGALCTIVRQSIAPALIAVMRVDAGIVASRKALTDLARLTGDPQANLKLEGNKAMDMQRVHIGALVRAMSEDLGFVKQALAQTHSSTTSSKDDQLAQDVRAQLLAVAARQQEALNDFGGLMETEAQGQMRTDYDSQLGPRLPTADHNSPPMPSPLSGSGLQLRDPVPVFDTRRLLTESTTLGHTLYDELVHDVTMRQTAIANAEIVATPTIKRAAIACGSTARPDR